MSLLEVLELIGYSTGAALHLWMGALLLRRRRVLGPIERVLLALTVGFGVWHASNLFVSLHAILGLDWDRWTTLLRLADTFAVVSITLSYSLLLHVHLHLWAGANGRSLTGGERRGVFLSYTPALFLLIVVPRLWAGGYAPMFSRLAPFVLPFALWAAYVLGLVAAKDLRIAQRSSSVIERRSMRTVAASLVVIGLLILAVYAFGLGRGTTAGLYLQTFANLGSLLPSALIAYYIYRFRYFELIIKESLVVASFAAVVLAVYLYGIRTFGAWLTHRYGLRPGVIESLLILALALIASPLRRWLEKYFHQLFEREAALYRDVVARISSQAGQYQKLPELLRFVEERAAKDLALRRVRILADYPSVAASDNAGEAGNTEMPGWAKAILETARLHGREAFEDEPALRSQGYRIAFALRREERTVGLMLVDAVTDALTEDVRAVLEVLAGQVAIAIEDCRLIEENVRLERKLAQGERLAALGQMAATVAHEVRNPLSAIKSIAQVMREDERLGGEYARDLSLIVGETDRLSRSVTQLLSFARSAPPAVAPCRAGDLARAIVELFHAESVARGVTLECVAGTDIELDGPRAAAVRDALSNLLLNALHVTPAQGHIKVETYTVRDHLLFAVTDSGPGVAPGLRERIWEPFFTTKQRGTGLGLAIVRKRLAEVGGVARLAAIDRGARFEILLRLG